jgi:hypothetical protein
MINLQKFQQKKPLSFGHNKVRNPEISTGKKKCTTTITPNSALPQPKSLQGILFPSPPFGSSHAKLPATKNINPKQKTPKIKLA